MVLSNPEIGELARLRPLTVVMKGERLVGHSEWEGAPALRTSCARGVLGGYRAEA